MRKEYARVHVLSLFAGLVAVILAALLFGRPSGISHSQQVVSSPGVIMFWLAALLLFLIVDAGVVMDLALTTVEVSSIVRAGVKADWREVLCCRSTSQDDVRTGSELAPGSASLPAVHGLARIGGSKLFRRALLTFMVASLTGSLIPGAGGRVNEVMSTQAAVFLMTVVAQVSLMSASAQYYSPLVNLIENLAQGPAPDSSADNFTPSAVARLVTQFMSSDQMRVYLRAMPALVAGCLLAQVVGAMIMRIENDAPWRDWTSLILSCAGSSAGLVACYSLSTPGREVRVFGEVLRRLKDPVIR